MQTGKRRGAALAALVIASLLSSPARLPAEPLAGSVPAAAAEPAEETLRAQQLKTRQELEAVARSMKLSDEKVKSLQDNINALQQTSATLRSKVIESAGRRREIEARIAAGERRLAELEVRQTTIRGSLHERRALLAEVLAALQRMGRNPPPALLVTPEDALASVRSAILLGAVVPGMRRQTDQLMADLADLARVRADIETEKSTLNGDMANRLEEERRMDLLIARNEALSQENAATIEEERRKAEALAARARSMDELIASLEKDIASAREAAEAARLAEEKRKSMTEAERQKARETALANPDQNRIAPAIPFGDLKGQLVLPVNGETLRRFGDDDGTGHGAKGITVATAPGALVTAPADAHVVFAGQFRSYGQMIILNTGDGYHLVLTGMDAIKTAQGKFVFAGEPLAVMGEKRVASAAALALETDRPTLYIEFRKDGKPVDSQPWWTAKLSGKANNDT
ncbi:murein hydrolase activator EnvC family protein [Gellertiella hungarica]|uniref:Septal ring factor EnvC (AmiA/AmiB activator) n=1 Tax=Gellertiella hungarica TaxID=1572859 RepID=A0A7W6J7N6_9HYPH|nr:murein hydrolase activator EnvC [Gellertiella hungarica]MBB4065462.1 septal ring factor EnvC (AmiA/AmiB activator) [Gellertiella hungarica]